MCPEMVLVAWKILSAVCNLLFCYLLICCMLLNATVCCSFVLISELCCCYYAAAATNNSSHAFSYLLFCLYVISKANQI